MLDPDFDRFENGPNRTRAGFQLRLAMHEAVVAMKQIGRLKRLGGTKHARAIDSWRRRYIAASDRASHAIDELWEECRWPTDAARARDYVWNPTRAA